jgi:hypothetical protein
MEKLKTKFRGKLINGNGIEWTFKEFDELINSDRNGYELGNFFSVKPETISEYTNLDDKKGAELYVGDLFVDESKPNFIYRIWKVRGGFAINVGVMSWQKDIDLDYPFPLQALADEQTVSWVKGSCTKVGNIFDNPELLIQK